METIKFTKAELNHLANLIADNERDGTYYGNRKQYWKRSFELKQKLLLFAVSSSYCPQCGVEHSTTAYIGFCSDKCLNKYQGNMTANVLRICEVRQTINLNIYKPLHGVSCIYAVSASLKFYGLHRTCQRIEHRTL